jgi:SAM-dependent methyltransferase
LERGLVAPEVEVMARIEPFEQHAGRYDAWFAEHEFAYMSELRALRALMPAHGPGIEIGAGTGRFAAPLAVVLGIEPSRAMARIARARGMRIVAGVAEAVPIAPESFDRVLLVTTICFVDDLEATLLEACRILRPGGALVIGLVDHNSVLGQRYQERQNLSVFYRAATFYSTEVIIEHLNRTGFQGLTSVQTIFGDPKAMRAIEPPRVGYGAGAFVVLRSTKPGGNVVDDRRPVRDREEVRSTAGDVSSRVR